MDPLAEGRKLYFIVTIIKVQSSSKATKEKIAENRTDS